MNDVINNPATGVPETNLAVVTAQAQKDFDTAREIYKQAGIELRLRGINFIADPNGHAGNPNTVSPRAGWLALKNTAVLTAEQTTLFGTSRSASTRDINIYYVLAVWNVDTQAVQPLNGIAYTNDYIPGMDNQTQSAIVISRYWFDVGNNRYVARINKTTQAHELGHFLLDNFSGGAGDGEHAPMNPFVLMSATGGDAYTLRAGEISNMQNNSDESFFIDRF